MLVGCTTKNQPITGAVTQGFVGLDPDTSEMGGKDAQQASDLLFVNPENVQAEQAAFVEKLKDVRKNSRTLVDAYIDKIGANGALDGIEQLWPKCHPEAHDTGKVIYSRIKDVGKALRVCGNRCYSACMHGVLMGAFTAATSEDYDGHVDIEKMKSLMSEICNDKVMTASYSQGDCAHAVGHALMVLTAYDIPEAITACKEFPQDHMEYYCTTGAYMEYVTERDEIDAKNKSLLYPCDTYPYPAACSRYKMANVVRRFYREGHTLEELQAECEKLNGTFRLGCFHGMGNGHMPAILLGQLSLKDVCLYSTEEEQFMCIEGAMERMAKYHEETAWKVCDQVDGKPREICLAAVKNSMYNMEKNLTLYLSK